MSESTGRVAIIVDRELCMGSGVCIAYAPGTFSHDEETKAVVIDPDGDAIGDIRSAAEGCPTGALTLVETEGGEAAAWCPGNDEVTEGMEPHD